MRALFCFFLVEVSATVEEVGNKVLTTSPLKQISCQRRHDHNVGFADRSTMTQACAFPYLSASSLLAIALPPRPSVSARSCVTTEMDDCPLATSDCITVEASPSRAIGMVNIWDMYLRSNSSLSETVMYVERCIMFLNLETRQGVGLTFEWCYSGTCENPIDPTLRFPSVTQGPPRGSSMQLYESDGGVGCQVSVSFTYNVSKGEKLGPLCFFAPLFFPLVYIDPRLPPSDRFAEVAPAALTHIRQPVVNLTRRPIDPTGGSPAGPILLDGFLSDRTGYTQSMGEAIPVLDTRFGLELCSACLALGKDVCRDQTFRSPANRAVML